jgi:hypothetical protein
MAKILPEHATPSPSPALPGILETASPLIDAISGNCPLGRAIVINEPINRHCWRYTAAPRPHALAFKRNEQARLAKIPRQIVGKIKMLGRGLPVELAHERERRLGLVACQLTTASARINGISSFALARSAITRFAAFED